MFGLVTLYISFWVLIMFLFKFKDLFTLVVLTGFNNDLLFVFLVVRLLLIKSVLFKVCEKQQSVDFRKELLPTPEVTPFKLGQFDISRSLSVGLIVDNLVESTILFESGLNAESCNFFLSLRFFVGLVLVKSLVLYLEECVRKELSIYLNDYQNRCLKLVTGSAFDFVES